MKGEDDDREKGLESLDKLMKFLTKHLENLRERKTTVLIAHLRAHPGMLLATEVAKLVSFGELYELLVRVVREIILGETGGMQWAEDIVRKVWELDNFVFPIFLSLFMNI